MATIVDIYDVQCGLDESQRDDNQKRFPVGAQDTVHGQNREY